MINAFKGGRSERCDQDVVRRRCEATKDRSVSVDKSYPAVGEASAPV